MAPRRTPPQWQPPWVCSLYSLTRRCSCEIRYMPGFVRPDSQATSAEVYCGERIARCDVITFWP
eukprot:scaffold170259_cov22-Prasinocladus_malaysianus.AAC.1